MNYHLYQPYKQGRPGKADEEDGGKGGGGEGRDIELEGGRTSSVNVGALCATN